MRRAELIQNGRRMADDWTHVQYRPRVMAQLQTLIAAHQPVGMMTLAYFIHFAGMSPVRLAEEVQAYLAPEIA